YSGRAQSRRNDPLRSRVASDPLAQQPADHLAGRGHRHIVDERDLARIFVRGEPRPHEGLNIRGERIRWLAIALEHDERLDDLGTDGIGLADCGRQRHRRMTDEAILDLARADAITRRGDDVVITANEIDVTVLVDASLIAGDHPVADEFLARRLRPLPVFQEHHRVGPLHRNLPDLAEAHRIALAIDDADHVARHWLADGARPRDADGVARRENEIAFGLTVEFVDHQAERLLAPFVGF